MKTSTLLQTTGLKPTELRALLDKSYGSDELVPFADMVLALIASMLLRSYSQHTFSLMSYFQQPAVKDILERIIADIEITLSMVQEHKKDLLLPVLMLTVTDSRYIGIVTAKYGPDPAVWDIEEGELVDASVYKWMWMSLSMNFSTLLLRGRNYMQMYPNVGIKKTPQGHIVATYLDKITSEVLPES